MCIRLYSCNGYNRIHIVAPTCQSRSPQVNRPRRLTSLLRTPHFLHLSLRQFSSRIRQNFFQLTSDIQTQAIPEILVEICSSKLGMGQDVVCKELSMAMCSVIKTTSYHPSVQANGTQRNNDRNTTFKNRAWTKATSLRCIKCRQSKKKCQFETKNEKCQLCKQTNKPCGPKLSFDQDKLKREEHNNDVQFWRKAKEHVEKRRHRGESRDDILRLLDPEHQLPISTPTEHTRFLYSLDNPPFPCAGSIDLGPALPSQDSPDEYCNPFLDLSMSATPQPTKNFALDDPTNSMKAFYGVGECLQAVDPQWQLLQADQQISASITDNIPGFDTNMYGNTNRPNPSY